MPKMARPSIAIVAISAIAFVIGLSTFAETQKTSNKPFPGATTSPSSSQMMVSAYTKDQKDKSYEHCFYRNLANDLYFDVKTDLSAQRVNFVLYNIADLNKPVIAEPLRYEEVKDGKSRIIIKADRGMNPPHLGPGPYMAVLTAVGPSSAMGERILGIAGYYYETWKTSQRNECSYYHNA